MPPESAPPTEPAGPPALAASVVGAVRTENARLDDIRQRAEAAATSPERSHIWQDARDVPALLALVGELTAQRDLARDAAVALEQENARLRQGVERLTLGDYDSDYSVPEFGRALLYGEDIGEPSLPLPLSDPPAAVLGLGLQPETSEQ